MTEIPLPGCASSWNVAVPGDSDLDALTAQLPDLLAAVEKQGVTSVPREACGELAMPERTTFLLLGLNSIQVAVDDAAGSPPVARVTRG